MVLVHKLFNNLVGLLGHLLVYILTLLVVFVDEMCLCQCFCEIPFNKQVNGFCAVLHSS